MSLEENKDKFRAFLQRHDALYKWDKNRNISIDRLFSERPVDDWINGAFNWFNTPEGHDYWSRLHRLWQVELNPSYPYISKITKKFKWPKIKLPKISFRFVKTFISFIQTKIEYIKWRSQFKKVKYYTLRSKSHCDTCDANKISGDTFMRVKECAFNGYADTCHYQTQLKYKKKRVT